MFKKYFQDELYFLHQMGIEFSKANPKLAPFLSGDGNDPDVERLLEGFAFLSGRIRQKLDDQFPELTHSLMSLLCPHYLRPIPALSILKFTPIPNAVTEKITIPKETEIGSIPVGGTPCRFRTCYDVDLYPLTLNKVSFEDKGYAFNLKIEFLLNNDIPIEQIKIDRLRIFLSGDMFNTAYCYLHLCHYIKKIQVKSIHKEGYGDSFFLDKEQIKPVGFSENEGLLPYPLQSNVAYRLIQEYFVLPQKFMFLDITGLKFLSEIGVEDKFEINFELPSLNKNQKEFEKTKILLYCTPIVNLFSKDADPIRLTHDKSEYQIRPSSQDIDHYEIYSVDSVKGWTQGGSKKHVYKPFISFNHQVTSEDRDKAYYKLGLHPAVIGEGADTYISFVSAQNKNLMPPSEVISCQLTCTNRHLPQKLLINDITVPSNNSPEFAQFTNITNTTPSIIPPIDDELIWQLVGNMSVNYLSLSNINALKVILTTNNFPAYYDKQAARANELRLSGIIQISTEPALHLLNGLPIRGLRTQIEIKESNFGGEAEMYLFSSILNQFYSAYTTINSFNQLIVKGVERGEVYKWKIEAGQRKTL